MQNRSALALSVVESEFNPMPITPSKEKQQISQLLLNQITRKINQSGAIPFSDYMAEALYHPKLGYYRNGLPKFGANGDFVTAPEVSVLFGYSLANQCHQVFQNTSINQILEFGAGSGQLACDLLTRLSLLNCLPNQYCILEPCAELRDRQKIKLKQAHPHFIDNIHWLTTLPENKINAIVIANEVLDAMPVTKFLLDHNTVFEYCVTHQQQQLSFEQQLASPTLKDAVLALNIPQTAQPYESEINLWLPQWITSLAQCLNQAAVFLIDYGFPQHEYYHPDRNTGTIMCHFEHQTHSDPLCFPGIQDITAHVDFTAIAQAAYQNQFQISGYTHQAAFLNNCGLLALRDHTNSKIEYIQAQQIKMLTLPSEMGELFKVIGLQKDINLDLIGFQSFDLSYRL